MKMTLLTGGDFEEILFKDVPRIGDVDVLVFASNILRRVDLVAEMEGSSSQIEQLCLLSRNLECVLLAGCDTEVCGTLHKSCVVMDEGELLGIVDMVNVIDEGAYSAGGGYRVFDTSKGKLGIIVGEDIYFQDVAKMLSLCESDILFSIFGKITNSLPEVMMRGSAFANGVDICMVAENYMQIADIKGELVLSGNERVRSVELRLCKDYHLVSSRRRGCYRERKSSWLCDE